MPYSGKFPRSFNLVDFMVERKHCTDSTDCTCAAPVLHISHLSRPVKIMTELAKCFVQAKMATNSSTVSVVKYLVAKGGRNNELEMGLNAMWVVKPSLQQLVMDLKLFPLLHQDFDLLCSKRMLYLSLDKSPSPLQPE